MGDVLAGEGVGEDEEAFILHDGSAGYWFDGYGTKSTFEKVKLLWICQLVVG